MSTITISPLRRFSGLSSFQKKTVVAAIVTAFSDWLIFGYRPGISVVLFALVLAIGIAVCHAHEHKLRDNLKASLVLLVSLIPIVEAFTPAGLAISITGMAIYSMIMTGTFGAFGDITWRPLLRLLVNGPFRFPDDWKRERKKTRDQVRSKTFKIDIRSWVVPLGLGAIFISLFMSANPLIEQFINWLLGFAFEWQRFVDLLWRAGFWVLFLAIAWAFLQPYKKYLPFPALPPLPIVREPVNVVPAGFFETRSVLRSLVLFNIIFASHTISDGLYLWGGAELPEGLSYARYAYRGTYALMAAAVMAAIFVLVAMRPDGSGARSPLLRNLVYLWIGQSVVMIYSVIYRLDLYLEIYALTYTRIAGFIWTGLVGAGLVLIIIQVSRRKSLSWLVRANVFAVIGVIYISSLVNFDHIIARYNVEHSQEVSGKGQYLDWNYLRKLGNNTLPAILTNLEVLKSNNPGIINNARSFLWVDQAIAGGNTQLDNWRAWGYRKARLDSFLGNYRKMQREDTAP